MENLSKVLRLLISFWCLASGTLLWAAPPDTVKRPEKALATAGPFLRVQSDARHQPIALQTATVRFVPASGEGELTVDLVGVVHIADRAYYRHLNQQLEQYDVVLYELVAPPGARLPRPGQRTGNNPLAMLHQLAKLVLDLESQMEQIDYTGKNFVHADLSPQLMAEAIRNRGDDGVTLFLSIVADLLRQHNLQERQKQENPLPELPEMDLLGLLLDADGPGQLKRLLAHQLVDFATPAGALGATLNTILITDRNQAALKVFQTELAKGKKRIAVFYGAAHMPDFEKRLREDFGLKRQSEQWLTAWDLRPKRNIQGLFRFLDR